jgi:arsenate reductase-like glutaredoxin family protein
MVVSNCDKDSLSKSKDVLSNQLTQKVQSDTQNSNSKVQVNNVRELSDGTLALDYECHDVSDQDTAKKTLNNAVKQDDVKETIVKSSKTDASSTTKSKQQTTNQPSEFIL